MMAPITVEQFSRLTLAIYTAAVMPEQWPAVITDVATTLGAAGGGLVTSTPDRRAPQCATFPDDGLSSYRTYYRDIDYVLADVEAGPVGLVRSGTELVARQAGSEFDADWMHPHDIQDGLFVRITARHPTTFLVATPRGAKPFATHDRVQLVNALVPHLQLALRTQAQLITITRDANSLVSAIDACERGIAIINTDSQVTQTNSAAARIITDKDGLSTHANRLHAACPSADLAMTQAIGNALGKGGRTVPHGSSVLCPRTSGRRPYVLHITPIGDPREETSQRRVLVLMIDPESYRKPDPVVLRGLFGLTDAEITVASHLLTSDGLQSLADQLFLSITTVKTHLQRVYTKTRTHRQAELVELLVRLSR